MSRTYRRLITEGGYAVTGRKGGYRLTDKDGRQPVKGKLYPTISDAADQVIDINHIRMDMFGPSPKASLHRQQRVIRRALNINA